MDVPSNWELKGFGEPIIRNIQYVFPANPPYVNVDNPVGTYRKVFTVPEGWDGREVLLHFGSISGYAQVFLNGKRIGMTKAAKTPAEFNVTPYLCEGENLLAVRVYRWHDGSYMEDQDFWRLTGIERDVYLQAYPKSTVWDFFLHAGLDNRYRDGIFNATVDLRAFADSEPGKGQVEMKLVDKAGKIVWAQKRKFEMKGEAETLSFSGRIKNVSKWTAETPELYDCILTLRDGEGNTSVTACKTGFRKIEIKNAKLMVNGTPVYIKGVNRHEHSDTLGHVQTHDLILDDLKQMKRLNINAIRTCHYPNHPDFYDLCDRYGFYVVDEANIENHGMGSVPYFKDTVNHPAYREDWYAAHVDRIDRMVKRDKNHPCVIGWSLGNECGNGKVFHDEYKRLKAYDPSRFVQFEQAWEDWNTDVVCLIWEESRTTESPANSVLSSCANTLMHKAIATEISRIYGMSFTTVPTSRAVSSGTLRTKVSEWRRNPGTVGFIGCTTGKWEATNGSKTSRASGIQVRTVFFLPTVRRSRRLGK